MMKSMDQTIQENSSKGSGLAPVLVCAGAFGVGVVLTFGYVQWKSQQQQLALMTQMVQQISQGQQPAPATATRNAPLDLLALEAPAQEAPAQVVPAAVAVTAPASDAALEAQTTADRIRALVSRASDPLVSAALAQDAARRETMSVAIQGVNELVDAAVAGQYTLTTRETANGATTMGIRFEGREEDQRQLESLLSSAANAGMIAFHDSVRSSDGSFSGDIILYDLIERALINGSPAERRTGEGLKNQVMALLGEEEETAVVTTPANASGERVYVVEAGDSLAFISLQFYGNTNNYLRIFQANRGVLSSPEKIQIGQRLVIPAA